jgi:hypothetical protein
VNELSYENVKLWFAKDSNKQIVTIDEINESNIHNTYLCPVCGSDLLPKATKSKRITPHFAHVDASKCNSESQIHFWFKHKFLEKGDKFTIVSDKEKYYIVKDILVEEPYETENGIYKPDVTILTECGNTIYFEMAFTNKKQVKDYLDIWLELKNIVVEIDIKQLIDKDTIPKFKALFYDGKCFNTKRNDTYYNTIGKYKEEKLKGKVDNDIKERIRKLDWFWDDVLRYKNGKVDIEHMTFLIDNINEEDREIVNILLSKKSCTNIFEEYINNKLNKCYSIIMNKIKVKYDEMYLKYINSYVAYDPYNIYDENIHGYIKVYDEEEHCSESYDIDRNSMNDIIDSICKIINRNIAYCNKVEKINKYNDNANLLEKMIKSNKIYMAYSKTISNKGSYKISCNIRSINKYDKKIIFSNINFNSFSVKFELNFGDNRTPANDFIAVITLNEDIEELCDLMINKFEKNLLILIA